MKKDNFKNQLATLGGKLKDKEDTTPLQEITPIQDRSKSEPEKAPKAEETKFTVHIPTELMDTIKELGFKQKKKIKAIFVEALEEYAQKHKLSK